MAVRRSVAAAVCLPLLAGLALAGCSGGDGPEPIIDRQAASTEPAPTESPSASPTAEPWEKRTKAGAVAFVKHWVDVFNEARSTGRTAPLSKLNDRSCKPCKTFTERLTAMRRNGGSSVSDGWTVTSTGLAEDAKANAPELQVFARIDQSKERFRRSADAKVEIFEADTVTYSFRLRWASPGWQLVDLDYFA